MQQTTKTQINMQVYLITDYIKYTNLLSKAFKA